MITVQFKDFNDMKMFAMELLGLNEQKEASGPLPVPQETAATVPKPTEAAQTAAVPVQAPAAMAQPPVAPSPAVSKPAVPAGSAVAPVTPVPAAVPTSTVSYTQDDLARAAMTLMDAGRQGELLGLLSQFGVASLPELPPAQYGAFATALRGLGAQI